MAKPSPIHAGRTLEVSSGSSLIGDSRAKPNEISWSKLKAKLVKHERIAESLQTYQDSTPELQKQMKDGKWVSSGQYLDDPTKRKGRVGQSHVLIMDMDRGPSDFERVFDDVLSQYECVVYSTLSHTLDKPKFRIFFPLKDPIDSAVYEPLSRAVADRIGIEYFDPTSHQAGRGMYLPTCCQDASPVVREYRGDWLDGDAILKSVYSNPLDVSEWPRAEMEGHLNRGSGELGDPRQKNGVIGAFCRTYTITQAISKFIPDIYVEGSTPDRFTFSGSATVNGAVVYDDDTHLFSHHSTDPLSRRAVNAYDMVREHLFGDQDARTTAPETSPRRPSNMAMKKLCDEDTYVQRELVRSNIKKTAVDLFTVIPDDDAPEGPDNDAPVALTAVQRQQKENELRRQDEDEDDAWLDDLETTESGQIKGSYANLLLIMQHDAALRGCLAFNQLKNKPVRIDHLPWAQCRDDRNGDPWIDPDDRALRSYITRRYNTSPTKTETQEAALRTCDNLKFHPVRDYLDSLEWDGTYRLDSMLYRHLAVEKTPYTVAVSRKFMVGAVERAFNPGCKFDTCMVLEGNTGVGKSTFIRELCADSTWFTDDMHDFAGQQAVESMQGKWIVELSELRNVKRTDVEVMKAFLSRQTDNTRLAYDRYSQDYPRQCIFIGTTNDSYYLTDNTGNRRFWPIRVGLTEFLDLGALRRERDQLWAEAVALYNFGESSHISDSVASQLAIEEQESRRFVDPNVDKLAQWLDDPTQDDWLNGTKMCRSENLVLRDRTCTEEILTECFKVPVEQQHAGKHRWAYEMMTSIPGWEFHKQLRFGNKYPRRRGFLRDGAE